MKLDKDISNKIYWGRFICAVSVIAIHSVNNSIKGILYNVEYIIRDYVLCYAQISVRSSLFYLDFSFIMEWKMQFFGVNG